MRIEWRITKEDWVLWSSMVISTVFVWIAAGNYGSFSSVYQYWDGPNYLFVAKTFYKMDRRNPWTKYFRYDPYYFACHLPGYPIFIRVCSILCFGNYILGQFMAIFVVDFLCVYSFRRMLIAYRCVKDPFYSTLLMTIFPLRFLIYHSVSASEPTFIAACSFSLLFYKTEHMIPMLISIFYACITRIEGLAILGTIGLCYLLKLRILDAIKTSVCFSAPVLLMLVHKIRFGDSLAYVHWNGGRAGLVKFPPMREQLAHSRTLDAQNYLYSSWLLLVPFIIGLISLFKVSIPHSIFCTVWLLYLLCLNHMDIYRYALPGYVYVLFIGLDPLLSSKDFRSCLKCLLPVYMVFAFWYAGHQLNSNKCWDQFMKEVLEYKLS